MRVLVLVCLAPVALAAACVDDPGKDDEPLADIDIVGVEPARVFVDTTIETLCIEADHAIFTSDRKLSCLVDGEPRAPLAPDPNETDNEKRACCDARWSVGSARGSIDVGVVLFEDGVAADQIVDRDAIEVRAHGFDITGDGVLTGPSGADYGTVNDWLVGRACPLTATWFVTGQTSGGLDLDIELAGDGLSLRAEPEPRCSDETVLESGALCMLSACVEPSGSGPFAMSITVRGGDEERVLDVTGDVQPTPMIDPGFGESGALFFHIAELVDGPEPPESTHVLPSLAVTSVASVYAGVVRYPASIASLLLVDGAGAVVSDTEILGLSFDSSLEITDADRVYLSRYGTDGREVIAVDAANPAGDPAYDPPLATQPYRIATAPASGSLWASDGTLIVLLDAAGTAAPGFPRSIYDGVSGAELAALTVDAAGAALVFLRVDLDGEGFWNDAILVRMLPDATLDPAFGESGVLVLETASAFATSAFVPAEPPIDDGLRVADAGVDADGSIVFAASRSGAGNVSFVKRLDASGAHVATFGDAGTVQLGPIVGAAQQGMQIAIAPDGRVLVAGTQLFPGAAPFLVALTPEGAPIDPPLFGRPSRTRFAFMAVACGPTACFAAGTASDAYDFLAKLE